MSEDGLKMNILSSVPNVISEGNYDLKKPDLLSGVDYLLGDPEYCLEDKYFLNWITNGTEPSAEARKVVVILSTGKAKQSC